MNCIKKKICMLGGFAVGKTSLVQQFVSSIFSDKYLTTVGVKMDQKAVTLDDGTTVELVLWDIHGDDEFQSVSRMYLRGMSGYLLVADGTRRSTLQKLDELHRLATATAPEAPFIVLINKSDLASEWEITAEDIAGLESRGWQVMTTSAKLDTGVDEAFTHLAQLMVRSE